MKKCGIYCITNTASGKRYIGQSQDIHTRRNNHFHELRTKKHRNIHLQHAFSSYSESSFVFDVLEEVEIEMLDDREHYWISFYKSDNSDFGYNSDSGGHSHKKLSEVTKLKIMARHLGRKHTPEARLHMSLSHLGKKNSEEHNRKISQYHLGRKRPLWAREKMAAAQLGKKQSPETIAKRVAKITGKKRTPEQLLKARDTIHSPASRLKRSIAMTGRVVSEETKRKSSETKRRLREAVLKQREMLQPYLNGLTPP